MLALLLLYSEYPPARKHRTMRTLGGFTFPRVKAAEPEWTGSRSGSCIRIDLPSQHLRILDFASPSILSAARLRIPLVTDMNRVLVRD